MILLQEIGHVEPEEQREDPQERQHGQGVKIEHVILLHSGTNHSGGRSRTPSSSGFSHAGQASMQSLSDTSLYLGKPG